MADAAPRNEPRSVFGALEEFLRYAWPAILIQIAMFALLAWTGQGQDVLFPLLQSMRSIILFLLGTALFSFFVWMLMRTFFGSIPNRLGNWPFFRYKMPTIISALFEILLGVWLLFNGGARWYAGLFLLILAFCLGAIFWNRRLQNDLTMRILRWSSFILSAALLIAACIYPVETSVILNVGPYGILLLGLLFSLVILFSALWILYRTDAPVTWAIGVLLIFAVVRLLFPDIHKTRCYQNDCSLSAIPNRNSIDLWEGANLDTGPQSPMILVASAGGGARAAYWTATVLGAIQDKYSDFGRRVFAISGVSGGALGAAAFDASLSRDPPDCLLPEGQTSYRQCLQKFLSYDFLSPILASMFSGDLVRQIVPNIFTDRAEALELAWEQAWRSTFAGPNWFARRFEDLWSSGFYRPSLLLNGTSVKTGERLVTTNLTLRDSSDRLVPNPAAQQPLYLSTAVNNSTRFPFVEPAGGIMIKGSGRSTPKLDFIVDGGYYDNYGAATMLDLLHSAISPRLTTKPNIRLVVVQISSNPHISDRLDRSGSADLPSLDPDCGVLNAGDATGQNDVSSASSLSGELGTIYQAAMGAREWAGLVFAENLRDWQAAHSGVDFRWIPFGMRGIDPPLGWSLSKTARKCIDQLISRDHRVRAAMTDLGVLLGH